jgi:hypothetical protein
MQGLPTNFLVSNYRAATVTPHLRLLFPDFFAAFFRRLGKTTAFLEWRLEVLLWILDDFFLLAEVSDSAGVGLSASSTTSMA